MKDNIVRDEQNQNNNINSSLTLPVPTLPSDMLKQIGMFADYNTLSNLSLVSKSCHTMFSPMLSSRKKELNDVFKVFLNHVIENNVTAVCRILENNKNLAIDVCLPLLKASIKENQYRTWRSVSAIEFAAWAGAMDSKLCNSRMLNVLLKYIPAEYQDVALDQLKAIRDKGTEHGAVMQSWLNFINATVTYIRQFNSKSVIENEQLERKNIAPLIYFFPLFLRQLYKSEKCTPTNIKDEFLTKYFRYNYWLRASETYKNNNYQQGEPPNPSDYHIENANFLEQFSFKELDTKDRYLSGKVLLSGFIVDGFYRESLKAFDEIIADLEHTCNKSWDQVSP